MRRIGQNSDIMPNTLVFLNWQVWMSHSDKVTRLPEGFHHIASTSSTENAAVTNVAVDGRCGFYSGAIVMACDGV